MYDGVRSLQCQLALHHDRSSASSGALQAQGSAESAPSRGCQAASAYIHMRGPSTAYDMQPYF